MIVTPVKTRKIEPGTGDIFRVLDESLSNLKDGSVVAVSSKIVAICEGRTAPLKSDLQKLVVQESDYYLPKELSKFDFSFSIVHNTLIPRAGIDESNSKNSYVLWPKDPQKSANEIRSYLKKRFGMKKVGVVITDSTAQPLHWGLKGIGISYSGFLPKKNYIGKPDLFGRPLKVSEANTVDSLAAAAVLVMGEGSEQTPIAVIEDVPFIDFQDRNPTKKELDGFYLTHKNDDLFEPFLKSMPWRKGHRQK